MSHLKLWNRGRFAGRGLEASLLRKMGPNMATDTAALLQTIYAAWREQRLGEIMKHLDEDFHLIVHLPAELVPGGEHPRSKAETLALLEHLKDTYDTLSYDQGPIIVADGRATVQPLIRYRHKKTGKVLETKLAHVWHFRGGKAIGLDERYDLAAVEAFLRSLPPDDT